MQYICKHRQTQLTAGILYHPEFIFGTGQDLENFRESTYPNGKENDYWWSDLIKLYNEYHLDGELLKWLAFLGDSSGFEAFTY